MNSSEREIRREFGRNSNLSSVSGMARPPRGAVDGQRARVACAGGRSCDEAWTRIRQSSRAPRPPLRAPAATVEGLYAALVASMPIAVGIAVAESDRIALRNKATSGKRRGHLTYGEMCFAPFAESITRIKSVFGGLAERGGVFYDLGSGTGKAVFAAACLHRFDACVGIELLPGLHDKALQLRATWDAETAPHLRELRSASAGGHRERSSESDGGHDDLRSLAQIKLLRGDIFDHTLWDWAADAALIMCTTTCFDRLMMQRLVKAASRCAKGTWCITWSKELEEFAPRDWKTRSIARQVMSWGKKVTIYIQEKIA